MTIFLMVLKKLIKQQLSGLSSDLIAKSKGYFYNHGLSLEQQSLIQGLDNKIILFEGTNHDETDAKALNKLIESYRTKVLAARDSHDKPKDAGATVTSLGHIIFHTNEFLEKLHSLNFQLWDKAYTETPEGIVYFHAAYYFGDEIFNPSAKSNPAIRVFKEKAICLRLQSLSELIKPMYNMEERRIRTRQVLTDLASDNERIVKQESHASFSVPIISFWGVELSSPTDWVSPGLGRFREQFNLALTDVNALKVEEESVGAAAVLEPLPAPVPRSSPIPISARSSLLAAMPAAIAYPEARSRVGSEAEAITEPVSDSELSLELMLTPTSSLRT